MLKKYGLPTETDIPLRELAKAAVTDKKRRGDRITLVIPEEIGKCVLKDIDISELEELVK